MNARELTRNAIITLVRESGGQMIARRLFGASTDLDATVREPEPLPALTAARALELAARDDIRYYAKRAREDGGDWAAIGAALGCKGEPEYGVTPGQQAFERFASDGRSGPSFAWQCPACGQLVIDRGPECGHPADQEQGHADGCTRLAEAVRAWDAQWGDEGDG